MSSLSGKETKITLLIGAALAGKTERVLRLYRHHLETYPASSALFILPSLRRVHDLKALLLQELSCPSLIEGRLVTFPGVARAILQENRQALEQIEPPMQRVLLQGILQTLQAEGRLSNFASVWEYPGFTSAVLELISELKRGAVEPTAFATIAAEGEFSDQRTRELAAIYSLYQSKLNELNLFDAEGLFWWACNIMDAGQLKPFEDLQLLLVDGFADWTPTQWRMLQHLVSRCEEAVFTLTLENPENSLRPELFLPARRTFEKFKSVFGDHIDVVYLSPEEERQPLRRLAEWFSVPLDFPDRVSVQSSQDESPVEVLTAPGKTREVEAIARRVKQLLLDGVPPQGIGVVFRDLSEYGEIARHVFSAFGIPTHIEQRRSLANQPLTTALFTMINLPVHDYRRTDVLQFFNSNYANLAEITTRHLSVDDLDRATREAGITGGAQRWIQALEVLIARECRQEKPSEDDDEESPILNHHLREAAAKSLDFFQRLQGIFADFPENGKASDFLRSVQSWLRFLRPEPTETLSPKDRRDEQVSLQTLRSTLEGWIHLAERFPDFDLSLSREEFSLLLREVLAEAQLPPGKPVGGHVQVMDAFTAREASFDHLFVGGLVEKEFPQLARESPFYTDAERRRLNELGINLAEVLPRQREEVFLFYQVITRARRRLYLSYPSCDTSGKQTIPSHYVELVEQCFPEGVPHREERAAEVVRPLAEVCNRRELADAVVFQFYRPQQKLLDDPKVLRAGYNELCYLAPQHVRALFRGAEAQSRRYARGAFDEFDGMLAKDDGVVASLGEMFPPDRPFRVTELGVYGTCPFRYFACSILKVEPPREPTEFVEAKERGIAYHKILRQFFLQNDGPVSESTLEKSRTVLHGLVDSVFDSLAENVSPAARALWEIERRLCHSRMEQFLKHELKMTGCGHVPCKEFLEVPFGMEGRPALELTNEGETVRLSGRIDRVDLVEDKSFAVYDYKTGSVPQLRDLTEGADVQLPAYAIAASELLFKEPMRPGSTLPSGEGMSCAEWGYYALGEPVGLRSKRPPNNFSLDELLRIAIQHIFHHARGIRGGLFQLQPANEACRRCNLKQLCRHEQWRIREKKQPSSSMREPERG